MGLAGILESGAADVFLEATRPDFEKIPLAVAGVENIGGAESLGARIKLGNRLEEVLKADIRRSLVFSLIDLRGIGISVGNLGAEADPSFEQAAERGVSVIVWGKAGIKNGEKDPDVRMDGYVYDTGSEEMVGGKRYVGSNSVVRLMAHRFCRRNWFFDIRASRASPGRRLHMFLNRGRPVSCS